MSEDRDLSVEVAAGLRSTATLVQSLLESIQGNAGSIARIESDLDNATRSVERLVRAVLDGNGHPPLMFRVSVLEENDRKRTLAAEEGQKDWRSVFVNVISGLIGGLIVWGAQRVLHLAP